MSKKVEKTCTFTQKWLDHLLLMTSCNYSNWPSLNLNQNVCEGRTNGYGKRQVLMFYLLDNPLVRPRVKSRSSVMNIHLRLSGFQSSFLIVYFCYGGPSCCSDTTIDDRSAIILFESTKTISSLINLEEKP